MTDENLFAPPTPRAAVPSAPEPSSSPDRTADQKVASVTIVKVSDESGAATPPSASTSEGVHDMTIRPNRLGVGVMLLVVLMGLFAGAGGGMGVYALLDALEGTRPADASLPIPATDTAQVQRPEGSVAAIAARALPSVVSIEVRSGQSVSSGSGMVVRADGYILTNNHVVAEVDSDADMIVTFSDGHEVPAELVGATPDYDLAVIRVQETGLDPLILGNSDDVVVGDAVIAVGSPLGLESTVTTGIVSALHRPVKAGEFAERAFIDAIQTDAAINPGNSGGPLLNSVGEVIGINSAIAQSSDALQNTGSIGLGFAIPSSQARHTAEQLIETGTATFPVIGVLLDPTYQGEGVQVAQQAQQGIPAVTPNGPADKAGLIPGDVILAFEGRPVSAADELIVAIRAKAPGDAVSLQVRSGDNKRVVRVVLEERSSGQ